MMRLVLLGPPGAGKGTQAAVMVQKYNIVHISTGDLLRAAVKAGSALGKEAKGYMEAGQLVPDTLILGLVEERIQKEDCQEGFLLDGFPRTPAQADALAEMLKKLGQNLDAVVNIEVPLNKLMARITGRRICKNCGATYHLIFNPSAKGDQCEKCDGALYQRADDTEETVKNRLDVYEQQTAPLIAYYTKAGIIKNINGDQDINNVLKDISVALGGKE